MRIAYPARPAHHTSMARELERVVPQVSIPRYSQFQPIGSGGFSQVYRAYRADQNQHQAVKVLALGTNREIDREAFRSECKAMGTVSTHPNVVTIFDNGFTNEGYPYIAMELCKISLTERIKQSPTRCLSVDDVLAIGIKVFHALEHAHRLEVLHRDLKPHNILFTQHGDPVLTDFGIASIPGDPESQHLAGLSYHYAAPEVFHDEPYDESCDIYSLGATLYSALAGRQPFDMPGNNDRELLAQRICDHPPPPITIQEIPEPVEREIGRLLAKHAIDRPRSAREARERLMDIQRRLGSTTTTSNFEGFTEVKPGVSSGAESQPPSALDDLTSITTRAETKPKSTKEFLEEERSYRTQIGIGALVVVIAIAAALLLLSGGDDDLRRTVEDTPPLTLVPTEPALAEPPTPDPPQRLAAAASETGVIFSWDQETGADSYRVYTTPGGGTEVTTNTEIEITRPDGIALICAEVTTVNSFGRESRRSEPICE